MQADRPVEPQGAEPPDVGHELLETVINPRLRNLGKVERRRADAAETGYNRDRSAGSAQALNVREQCPHPAIAPGTQATAERLVLRGSTHRQDPGFSNPASMTPDQAPRSPSVYLLQPIMIIPKAIAACSTAAIES